MATLQKFKFLATQCAVIGSPTRSPTTSPVVHLRRRKTLRMLLGRTGGNNHHRRFHRRDDSPDPPRAEDRSAAEIDDEEEEEEHRRRQQHHRHQICVRHKLKDLFVSSPPPLGDDGKEMDVEEAQRLVPPTGRVGDCGARISGGGGAGGAMVVAAGRTGAGAMRPLSATLRQRLLRRAWRPVLVAIPEQSP